MKQNSKIGTVKIVTELYNLRMNELYFAKE